MLNETIFTEASLVVVGNLNRDIKTATLLADANLIADGETSTKSIIETIGGGGANSAFAAKALGANVGFSSKVGADSLGDRLKRTLDDHRISAHLARDPQQPSGTSIALSFDNGQRHFISCLPANEALTFDDLTPEVWAGRAHLLRADVWFSESMLFGGNQQLLEVARQSGLQTSIDLNWDPQWGHPDDVHITARKQAVRDVLPLVNLAHGNVPELMEFADAPDLDTALKRITNWGAEALVVHLGAEGAGYFSDGKLLVEPPAPVRNPVNTAGTGDVLSICMILLHHRDDIAIEERLRLSNHVVAEFMEGRRTLIPLLSD
jgi:sugar/nucleoside kinase (ribokinase family)